MTLLIGIILGVALALIVMEIGEWLGGHYPPDRRRHWRDSDRRRW